MSKRTLEHRSTRNMPEYETFFDFVKRRHFIKARDFQKRNADEIEAAMNTKEGIEYFAELSMDIKERYFVYLTCYKER